MKLFMTDLMTAFGLLGLALPSYCGVVYPMFDSNT